MASLPLLISSVSSAFPEIGMIPSGGIAAQNGNKDENKTKTTYMNGYERIMAVLKGEPHDRVPVMLHNFMMAAREINFSMKEVVMLFGILSGI